MNTLRTDILGGFPYVLDDFDWHRESELEAITEIVKGLNGGNLNCIISGCEWSPVADTWDISEGYMLVNGEIVKHDAQTGVPDTDQGFDYWQVVVTESFDPAGTKALEDGGSADAYRVRRAVVQGNGFFPVGSDLRISPTSAHSFPRLAEVVAENADAGFDNVWLTVNAATIDALPNTNKTVVSGSIRYKKVGRVMFIEGNLVIDMGGGSSSFQLEFPAALLPAQEQQGLGIAILNNAGGLYQKTATMRHSIDSIFNFTSDNNAYTYTGSGAEVSFSAQYRVNP